MLALRDILHTSVAHYSLFVLKMPLNTKQTNSFSVWHSLPNNMQLSDMSLETFRSRLKAFLFGH